MTVVSLETERATREEDNTKLTPAELLKVMEKVLIDDAADGFRATRMVAVVEFQKPDGGLTIGTYRCGCSRLDEIALLGLAHHKQVEDLIL